MADDQEETLRHSSRPDRLPSRRGQLNDEIDRPLYRWLGKPSDQPSDQDFCMQYIAIDQVAWPVDQWLNKPSDHNFCMQYIASDQVAWAIDRQPCEPSTSATGASDQTYRMVSKATSVFWSRSHVSPLGDGYGA